jgi:hypothetical protein
MKPRYQEVFKETMKAILIVMTFAFASLLVPVYGYSQGPTATLLTQQQCLDFNQDKICEYVVLANGTMVANPSVRNATVTTLLLKVK